MAKQKGIDAKAWFYSQSFHSSAFDRVEVVPASMTAAEVIRNADRTEYCVECKTYHDRPTWPTPHAYQGSK